MKKFIFVMSHAPTAEQITAASEGNREVVQVTDKKLLIVPEDINLGREWFTTRAEEVLAAVGGVQEGDTLHVMGQQQLAAAIQSLGRKAGVTLVESVTPRVSVDKPQADGTIKKEMIFSFKGFRTVHEY